MKMLVVSTPMGPNFYGLWQEACATIGETLEKAAEPPVASDGPPELHVFLRSQFPVALCGYRAKVAATFDEALKHHTPGADRCAECLRLAREIRWR